MFKALVIKELRESAGIVVLAVLGIVYAISGLTGLGLLPWQGRGMYWYPFLSDQLSFYFALCIGGLAIALGFKQTAWELGHGTFFFLLHRPVNRTRVFASKLLVGLFWVLFLSALMILVYAWIVSRPGWVAAPIEWSMMIPAWQQWLSIPVVYFGAFLSGIRPGNWYGTRLAPLLAALLVASACYGLPWVWMSVILQLAAIAMFTIGILYYARQRDY